MTPSLPGYDLVHGVEGRDSTFPELYFGQVGQVKEGLFADLLTFSHQYWFMNAIISIDQWFDAYTVEILEFLLGVDCYLAQTRVLFLSLSLSLSF